LGERPAVQFNRIYALCGSRRGSFRPVSRKATERIKSLALGDRHGEGSTLNNLGNVYQSQSRWAEAIAVYEQRLAIYRELGDRHREGQTLNNLGIVYRSQSRWAEAIAVYEQSLAIYRELDYRARAGERLNN